jgi:hypothetical protein
MNKINNNTTRKTSTLFSMPNKKNRRGKDSKSTFIGNYKTECTYLVPYQSSIYSSLGMSISQLSRNITQLTSSQFNQLIGHLLGDGSLSFSNSESLNPRFVFSQGVIHFAYC